MAGLREVLPAAQTILSINGQSGHQTAHQLTIDALSVYPTINMIFAINDSTAWGAVRACQDMGVNPDSLLLLTFGLEGDTLKNALRKREYCKAGLAMFPEIVGPVCIELTTINPWLNIWSPPMLFSPLKPYRSSIPEARPAGI
jgi:ribose transport system substrate-binding protein